jgi:hypothetical protein
MATIRTQLVDGDRRIITKVVNGQRRVSCSCCCLCQIFDTEMLLNFSKNDHYTRMKRSVEVGGPLSFFSVEEQNYQSENLGFRGFDYQFSVGGINTRPTSGRIGEWLLRKPACLRWLCRCVEIDENEDISVIQQHEYGGPTVNNLDLWEDVVLPRWGEETESGTFLYIVIFLGLFRRLRSVGVPPASAPDYPGSRFWEPRDDEAYILKERITKISD